MGRHLSAVRILSILTLGYLAGPGCNSGEKAPADSSASPAASSQASVATAPGTPPDAAHVLDLAKKYTYPVFTNPVKANTPIGTPNNIGAQKPNVPTMQIARAVPGSSPIPAGEEILAVIHSDKSYPGLGVFNGDNYVWRNRADKDTSKWEVWVVAAKNKQTALLVRGPVALADNPTSEPRLVVQDTDSTSVNSVARVIFAACLQDPICQSGHCGYSQ